MLSSKLPLRFRSAFDYIKLFVFVVMLFDYCSGADLSGRVGPGGALRYRAGRWGVVRGSFANSSSEPKTMTAVVTPNGRSGSRFLRTIRVPPQAVISSVWPVYLDEGQRSNFEFDVMFLQGDRNSQQIIKDSQTGEMTDGFVSRNSRSNQREDDGICGIISTANDDSEDSALVAQFAISLRKQAGAAPVISVMSPSEIRGYAAALDALDQLVVASDDMQPETSEAIRLWIQRGGQALVMLDQCGEEAATAILGDAIPISIVDRTSTVRVPLKYDALKLRPRLSDLSHLAEFVEPVRIARTFIERGNVHWSFKGWPIVVEAALGEGTVFITTMSPDGFFKDGKSGDLDSVATPIVESIFKVSNHQPRLTVDQLSAASQTEIGYAIPNRSFAMIVLGLFTVALGIVSWVARKRNAPGLILVATPLLCMCAAVPGFLRGAASRGVAPPTLMENRFANVSTGQSVFAVDGAFSVYQPFAEAGDLLLPDQSLIPPDGLLQEPQFVWEQSGNSSWIDFSQPVGLVSYRGTGIARVQSPMKAIASFGEDDLEIWISNADVLKPEDVVVAGTRDVHLALESMDDGSFSTGSERVLAVGQFSWESFVTKKQAVRSDMYRSLLAMTAENAFPSVTSVLFFTDHLPASINAKQFERIGVTTLISLPLEYTAPPVGREIAIPPTMLPFTPIPEPDGALAPIYDARNKAWLERKPGTSVTLRFDLPEACKPFNVTSAEAQLRIMAGSRAVIIQCGSPGDFQNIETLSSPVGNFTFTIPADLANSDPHSESVHLRISVSDLLAVSAEDDNMEQDNFWKVERLFMTVHGHRLAASQLKDATGSIDALPDSNGRDNQPPSAVTLRSRGATHTSEIEPVQ